MSMKDWERNALAAPGAAERVAEIEQELRLVTALIALREQVGQAPKAPVVRSPATSG